MNTVKTIAGISMTGITPTNEEIVTALVACIDGGGPFNGEPTVDAAAAAKIIQAHKLANWPTGLEKSGAFFDSHTTTESIAGVLRHYGRRLSRALQEVQSGVAVVSDESAEARKMLGELPTQRLDQTVAAFVGFSGEFAESGTIRHFLELAADGAEVFVAVSRFAGVAESVDTSVEEFAEVCYQQIRGSRLVRELAKTESRARK